MSSRNKKNYRHVLRQLKSYLGCYNCGEDFYLCLEYHHLHLYEKYKNVSKLTGSLGELLDEVSKCIVMCTNCHRKLHAGHNIKTPSEGINPEIFKKFMKENF